MTRREKGRLIGRIMCCDTCRGFLAASMETPIRCPGMDYRKVRGKLVAYTNAGILWNDYILRIEKRDRQQRLAYYKRHERHLVQHGLFGRIKV